MGATDSFEDRSHPETSAGEEAARTAAESLLVGSRVMNLLQQEIEASPNGLSAGFLILDFNELRRTVLPDNNRARAAQIAEALDGISFGSP